MAAARARVQLAKTGLGERGRPGGTRTTTAARARWEAALRGELRARLTEMDGDADLPAGGRLRRRAPGCWTPRGWASSGWRRCRSCGRSSCPTTAGPTTRPSSCGAGRTPALVAYGLAMVRIWRDRGFADTTDTQIAEFAPDVAGTPQAELAAAGLLPSWVGDEALHRSHRSNLIAKDPDFYRPRFAELFGAEPDDLPYVWPRAGRRPAAAGARGRPGVGGATAGARRARAPASPPGSSGWAPSRASTSTPPASRRRSCGRCRRSSPDGGRPRTCGSCRPSSTRSDPGTRSRCRSSTAPGCCSARSWATTCSRAASCCRTGVPRGGTASSRGRRRCPPATLQDPRALFSVVLDPAALPSSAQ